MNCKYLYKILVHFPKIMSLKKVLLNKHEFLTTYVVKIFLKTLFWKNVLIFYKDIYNS